MKNTGLKRKTIDKFYTSPHIVNECLNLIKQKINIQETDLCIEPSAGNGSFINGIKLFYFYLTMGTFFIIFIPLVCTFLT